jgi:methionine-rich copper-binding protein CopC
MGGPSLRRVAILSSLLALAVAAIARAEEPLKVVETGPAANAVLKQQGESFFVRFDRPIDHMRSRLIIMRDGQVVETLQPRLKTEPNVLFAQAAPPLADGHYTLTWVVKTVEDKELIRGSIPFSVNMQRPASR